MNSFESSISPDGRDSSPSRADESTTTLHTCSSPLACHGVAHELPTGRVSSGGCDTSAHHLEASSLETVSPSISTTRSSFSTVYAEEWPNFIHHHPPAHARDHAREDTVVSGELEMARPAESQPLKNTSTPTDQDHTNSLLEKTDGGASHETIWAAWWLEMLSSLLALGCIISIAIILFLYDKKPLPDWPALISVNSLTAIFTAVFKAALIMPIAEGLGQLKWNWFQQKQKLSDVVVFDDASRGPWGSLVLIAKQLPRRRRAYLAVIGSLITLAALAVDPASQAMIEHRGCQLTRASSALEVAEISRTNNYTASRASYPEFMEWALDPVMEAALHKGLMDPEETESQVKFECATGNCTFLASDDNYFFSSLSMCHSCQDITHNVIEDSTPNVSKHTLPDERSWSLLTKDENGAEYLEPQITTGKGRPKLSIVRTPLGASEGFISYDVLMLQLSCGNKDRRTCDFESKSAKPTPFAARCKLHPCVKRFRGRVTNGVYKETESQEPGQPLRICHISGSDEQIAWSLITNSSLIDGEERQCTATADWKPQTVKVDTTYGSLYAMGLPPEKHLLTWEFYPQECVWAVGYTAYSTIFHTLGEILPNNVTSFSLWRNQVVGPIWLKPVYALGSGNISTVETLFRGLANSMTAALRNNPGPEGSPSHLSLTVSSALRLAFTFTGAGFHILLRCSSRNGCSRSWSWPVNDAGFATAKRHNSAQRGNHHHSHFYSTASVTTDGRIMGALRPFET